MRENLTVGFIGNPNCGKTTLFNAYTGANLKVANWPGVTVEKVEGAIKDHDLNIRLVDLPGTYSLTSYTMEEQVSRQFILSSEVDVIIDVADASSLERNLYLTLQLLELGKPVVLALNMMDIVEKRGMEIDTHRLPEMLGIPVIPVSARKRTGLDVLIHAAAHHKDCKDSDCLIHHHKYASRHQHDHHSEYAMVYSDVIEDKIDLIMAELKKNYPSISNYRWHAIKLLEQDKEISERYPISLPDVIDRNYESDIINEKYDFIQEIIKEVLINKERQEALTEKIDRVLTHRFWSIPIFLGIMALVFFMTFTIGDWLKGYFQIGIESFSVLIDFGGCWRSSEISASGRYHCWCRWYSNIPAKHRYSVSGTGISGGQRIHGSCCLCHGRNHEQAWFIRQSIYSYDIRIWMYGSCNYGIQSVGKSA